MDGRYIPIKIIIKKYIHHKDFARYPDRLYQLTKNNYPELFEDLVITGRHCILLDNISKYQKSLINNYNKIDYIDNKILLPCFLDKKSSIYKKLGVYAIYHFALENTNVNKKYGVYANGLLVESCSIKICNIFSKL